MWRRRLRGSMGKTIKINISDRNPFIIEETRIVLRNSGVAAIPTDTFYGLGVDPFNTGAIEKIYQIKGRNTNKPLLLLIEATKRLGSLIAETTKDSEILMRELWPGPLTIIFRASSALPAILTADTGKIGIRLPASSFLIWLLEGLDMAITATSANPSGLPPAATADSVERYFSRNIDLIIDAGRADGILESTVIDATATPMRLIREGMIKAERLEELIGKINRC